MAGHARDTPPQPGANTAALNRAWTHGLGFNPSRKVKTTQSTTHTHTAHAQRCRKATQLHALPICSFSTAAQDRMGVVQVHPTAMTVLFGWLWVLVFGEGALDKTTSYAPPPNTSTHRPPKPLDCHGCGLSLHHTQLHALPLASKTGQTIALRTLHVHPTAVKPPTAPCPARSHSFSHAALRPLILMNMHARAVCFRM